MVPTSRLAELTVALSLATDLGTGQPMEHGLRTCWLALATADGLGVDPAERSTIYYVALLRFLGCTSDAADTSLLAGGNELRFNATMARALNAPKGEGMSFLLRQLGADLPPPAASAASPPR